MRKFRRRRCSGRTADRSTSAVRAFTSWHRVDDGASLPDHGRNAIRAARKLSLATAWLIATLCAFATLTNATSAQITGQRANSSASVDDPPPRPAAPVAERGLVLPDQPEDPLPVPPGMDVERMLSPQGMPSTLKIMLLLTVLSLAPSILIMTTCFIRFIIVFGLLRQALGTQQLPPNQVIISLCLFLTLTVMAPTWKQAYEEGIRPYSEQEQNGVVITQEEALRRTLRPVQQFMGSQIEKTGNSDTVWLFLKFQKEFENPDVPFEDLPPEQLPSQYDQLPLTVLLPSFMLSELKTAFVIGFQVYLPFLIIDMVIASVLISMGMMMLPPVLISLPFKLLLFVMIDGWYLTVGMLMESVRGGFG